MKIYNSLPVNVRKAADEYRKDFLEWYSYLSTDVDKVPARTERLKKKQLESFRLFLIQFVYHSDVNGDLFDELKEELKDTRHLHNCPF